MQQRALSELDFPQIAGSNPQTAIVIGKHVPEIKKKERVRNAQ